jgi:hypothetical protein
MNDSHFKAVEEDAEFYVYHVLPEILQQIFIITVLHNWYMQKAVLYMFLQI